MDDGVGTDGRLEDETDDGVHQGRYYANLHLGDGKCRRLTVSGQYPAGGADDIVGLTTLVARRSTFE